MPCSYKTPPIRIAFNFLGIYHLSACGACTFDGSNETCNQINDESERLEAAKIVRDNIENYTYNNDQRLKLNSQYEFVNPEVDELHIYSKKNWIVGHDKAKDIYHVLFSQRSDDNASFQVECKVKCRKLVENCDTLNQADLH